MKKSGFGIALATLAFCASCSAGGLSLTKENASTYLGFTGSWENATPTLKSGSDYTVTFDIYAQKYGLNSNIKGTCSVTFTPVNTHLKVGTPSSQTASFKYHAAPAEGQADFLEATFDYTSALEDLTGTSTVKDLVFLTISGTVQGGN